MNTMLNALQQAGLVQEEEAPQQDPPGLHIEHRGDKFNRKLIVRGEAEAVRAYVAKVLPTLGGMERPSVQFHCNEVMSAVITYNDYHD
jgi:hypothetical protein